MKKTKRSQQGFTLVELMISLTLGLFIVLALVVMLINVNRNNNELSTVNRVIENGRFASQLLAADIAHSGYWAGHVPEFDDLTMSVTALPADVPTGTPTGTITAGAGGVPDPCVAFALWNTTHKNNLVGIAVQGTDIPDPVPSPTTPFCSSVVTNPQPGTDVIVVRHVEPCLVGTGTDDCSNTFANESPHLYFQASRCSGDPATFVLGNTTATFTLKAGDCVAEAPIRRFSSSIYYVRDHANQAGDGIPTLMRARFGVSNTAAAGNPPEFLSAQAMVEGVEGFRVEYGVDDRSDTNAVVDLAALRSSLSWASMTVLNTPQNRGDGLPDRYVRCSQASPCTGDQLVNVTTVKLYVLVRSERPSPNHTDTKKYCLASSCSDPADYMGPFNDRYKRHLFTQTIRLTNVAMRRETS